MCNVQRIIFGPNLVNHLRFFQFINSNYSSLREYRPMLRQFNECPPAALSLRAPHSAWPDKCHRSRSAREAFNLNICSSVKPDHELALIFSAAVAQSPQVNLAHFLLIAQRYILLNYSVPEGNAP